MRATRKDRDGRSVEYTFWQASREVPAELLPEGVRRKRVTGNGATQAIAMQRLEKNFNHYISPAAQEKRSKRGSKRITVEELYGLWQRDNEMRNVSEVMRYKYAGYFKNHILPTFGNRYLDDLETDELARFFGNALLQKPKLDRDGVVVGKLLTTSATYNIYMAFHGALRYAVERDYLRHNPLSAVHTPDRRRRKDDVESASSDAMKLLAMLEREDSADYCRWLFQFLGLRRSERLGLAWSSVHDLYGKLPRIVVEQQLARHTERGEGWYLNDRLKTKESERTIFVPMEPFVRVLRKHKELQDSLKSDKERWQPEEEFADLVFLQPNGLLITPNRDNNDWKKVLETHGFKPWRGHLNRHITATLFANMNPPMPMSIVRSILGHSTESMSWYYTAINVRMMANPMEAFGEMMTRAYVDSEKDDIFRQPFGSPEDRSGGGS